MSARTVRLLLFLLAPAILHAQFLIFERRTPSSPTPSLGWKDDKAFLADDFRVGQKGETWMIDKVRAWMVLPSGSNSTPETLYSKITLFGGIVDTANSKVPRPADDCDCHGVIRPVKSVDVERQSSPDLKISPAPDKNVAAGGTVF